MPNLCVTVRFLQPYSHGRGNCDEPEWPPSPLRVFQALVATAAARWNERMRIEYAAPALHWLERQSPPDIVAATGVASDNPYLLYIPNNAEELLIPAWKRGDINKGVKREQKLVRPVHLSGETVHYLYSVADGEQELDSHLGTLQAAVRHITHVGWGVDVVAADAKMVADEDSEKLLGERWRPFDGPSGNRLRIPIEGTLRKLTDKHQAFLNRVSASENGMRPVPPLVAGEAFRVVGYRRATDRADRPFAAFAVLKTDASGFRPFDPARATAYMAGMVRHAAARAARDAGWDDARINSFVLGHGDDKDGQATTDDRLQFLPLPSITPLKVEAVRRVLVAGPPGADLGRVGQLLAGAELVPVCETEPVAMLAVLPQSDKGVGPYVRAARVWTTVTPVVLPGHEDPDGLRQKLRDRPTAEAQKGLLDRLDKRVLGLLRRAFEQAGFPKELADRLGLEYRGVGFRPGVDLAGRYDLPPLRYPKYHVRVRFPEPVRGPLAVGAGRYRGMGLFAAEAT